MDRALYSLLWSSPSLAQAQPSSLRPWILRWDREGLAHILSSLKCAAEPFCPKALRAQTALLMKSSVPVTGVEEALASVRELGPVYTSTVWRETEAGASLQSPGLGGHIHKPWGGGGADEAAAGRQCPAGPQEHLDVLNQRPPLLPFSPQGWRASCIFRLGCQV